MKIGNLNKDRSNLKTLFKNVNYSNKNLIVSVTSLLLAAGISTTYFLFKSKNIFQKFSFKQEKNQQKPTDDEILDDNDPTIFTNKDKIRKLYKKYSNNIDYIDKERVENLALYARLKYTLKCLQLANQTKTKHDVDKAIHELTKLSSLNELNDGLAQLIRQLITDNHDLILNLATNSKIDNRIFPDAPPSIQQQLRRFKCKSPADRSTTAKIPLADDDDFNFIFDFYEKIKATQLKFNKSLKFYIKKFSSALNSLLMHDFKSKSNLLVLNDDLIHDNDLYQDQVIEEDTTKDFKSATKNEFLLKLEYLILQILDSYAKFNEIDFIKFGGLDSLLILYEKNKFNMEFIIPIFDILSILSLNYQNKKLFIQSGWIKRIHELILKLNNELNTTNLISSLLINKLNIENYYKSLENALILKLILYKIMFNLKSNNKIVYSNMIYPLYPLKNFDNNLNMESSINALKAAMREDESDLDDDGDNENRIDVIFIHGLLGSVFKTWRQDDHCLKQLYDIVDKLKLKSESINDIDNKTEELKDKLKTIFDNSSTILPNLFNYINYTYCWPRDWLAIDFHNKINVYGINYSSILSYWGYAGNEGGSANNTTIKMRSNELINQLNLANIGKKPIVWVCHSMGGLILKQMLLTLAANSENGSDIIKNTKAIVFYSTPHLGSALAKRAMNLSLALWPSNEIEELSLNNSYLKKLNEEFINLTQNKNWKIISFCENFTTHVGYNLNVRLVGENSARLPANTSEFIALDTDHLYICKPNNKESIIYKKVFNLINEIYLNFINEKQQQQLNNNLNLKRKRFLFENYFYKQFLF